MKKPEQLRRLLLATALAGQGEKLTTFIDRGAVACRGGRDLAFEYRYTLSVVVQAYAGSIDALMVPVLAWVAEVQPELLDRAPHTPFTFESELLDADHSDVSIEIELTERVRVTRTGTSTFDAVHLGESTLDDAFVGICGVPLARGLVDGAVTAEVP